MIEIYILGGMTLIATILTISYWVMKDKMTTRDTSGREISDIIRRTRSNEREIKRLRGKYMSKELCTSKQDNIELQLKSINIALGKIEEKLDGLSGFGGRGSS